MTSFTDKRVGEPCTFQEMIAAVLEDLPLATSAKGIGVSPQYLHDLKTGRRLPSVNVVNKICKWMGRGPRGRLEWHVAGAIAHGWELYDSLALTGPILHTEQSR